MAFEYQGFASLGVNLNRQKYGPLDISSVFTSEADLRYYLSKGAFTEGVSEYWYKDDVNKIAPYPYEGQVLATVIDGVVNVYTLALDGDGNFVTQEIAGKIEADEASITVNEDGKVALKGFNAAGSETLPRKRINAQGEESLEWVSIGAITGNTKTVVQAAEGSIISVEQEHSEQDDTYTYTIGAELPAAPEYTVTKEEGTDDVTYKVTKDGTPVGDAIVVPNAYDDSALDSRVYAVERIADNHEGRISSMEVFFDNAVRDQNGEDGQTLSNALDTLKEIQDYLTNEGTATGSLLSNVEANTAAIALLNKTDGTVGSVQKTVDDAVAAQAVVDDAARSAMEGRINTALAGKVDNATLGSYYTKDQTYDKGTIDNKIAELLGADFNPDLTVANLNEILNSHISTSDSRFTSIENTNTQQNTTIQEHTDAIAAINDTTNGILAKATTAAASDAQQKVDNLKTELTTGNGAVAKNAADITALSSKVDGLSSLPTTVSGLSTDLSNLDLALDNEIQAREALQKIVNGEGGHAAQLTALRAEDVRLAGLIDAANAKFNNYYNKTETGNEIASQISSNNVTLNQSITTISTKITNEEARAKEREDDLAGLINTNTGEISKNAAAIEALNRTLANAIDNDTEALDSIKELADWVTKHDGASGVLATVNANKAAIELLNKPADTEGSVAHSITTAFTNTANIASTTKLGLVKASDEVNVADDGRMYLGANVFSTDRLVQGTTTLVLNGGTANA